MNQIDLKGRIAVITGGEGVGARHLNWFGGRAQS